jgi:uncharacterized protein (TIGR00375 family)
MYNTPMPFIADLHLHSRFAYACSKELSIAQLAKWGMLKGIKLLATGDFTHPAWLKELQRDLEPLGNGLFRPKEEIMQQLMTQVPATCYQEIFFMLQTEVSTIYRKNDKVRKIHHLLYVPSFSEATKINEQLAKIGNIASDGRPILGMDSEDLLKIVIDSGPESYLVPAHAWTPHFAVFGSNSGFDLLEDCYGALTSHIFAIETGLSSDPEMNRQWSALDDLALISGSDSHSAPRIGREANIFNTELTYSSVWEAVKRKDSTQFVGTLEFFPHEGRYHYDGHRNCQVVLHPQQSQQHNNICPVCNKKLTLGVLHRVLELADRKEPSSPENYYHMIPLVEVVAEIENTKGVQSKKVQHAYFSLLHKLGPEIEIMLHTSLADIQNAGGLLLAKAIEKIRQGTASIQPGYDGLYGVIQVFSTEERKQLDQLTTDRQLSLV